MNKGWLALAKVPRVPVPTRMVTLVDNYSPFEKPTENSKIEEGERVEELGEQEHFGDAAALARIDHPQLVCDDPIHNSNDVPVGSLCRYVSLVDTR